MGGNRESGLLLDNTGKSKPKSIPEKPSEKENSGKIEVENTKPPSLQNKINIAAVKKINKDQTFEDITSKVKLENLEELKTDKNPKNIEELNKKVKKINTSSDSYDKLKSETEMLETAQIELEKIKQGTKKDLSKRLPPTKSERIIEKLEKLGLFGGDGTITESGKDNLSREIEEKNILKAQNIDKEIELLEELKKTEGLTGTDKDGNKVTNSGIKSKIDKKLEEKKSEKERTRKKHWWERVFFHKNDTKSDYNTVHSEEVTGFWKNIKTDISSTKSSLFISYCLFSIIVFTATLMTIYNDSSIFNSNQKIMNSVRGLYYFGIVIIGLFLASLSLSFGQDKDIEQKIGSFIILLGGIYMGSFFTYLDLTNAFVQTPGVPTSPLNSQDNFLVKIALLVFLLFLIASIYYVLFDKRGGKYARIFNIIYCLVIVFGFLFIGGGFSYVYYNLETTNDYKKNLLFPIGSFLYGFGIFLLVFSILNSIPAIEETIVVTINTVLGALESFKIKVFITLAFFMIIYYGVSFRYVYKYLDKENRISGISSYLKTSYEIAFGIVALLVLALSLSFGGDLKEKIVSFILVLFILYVGGLLAYLDHYDHIQTSGEETTVLTSTLIVYCILVVACIIYTLFKKRNGDEALSEDILRVITNFGAILMFLYMFAIGTGVVFDDFLFHHPTSPEAISLWIGFGIGAILIIGIIYLMFF